MENKVNQASRGLSTIAELLVFVSRGAKSIKIDQDTRITIEKIGTFLRPTVWL